MDTPFLTADLPGIGGTLKSTPEDFVVEEIPLYPAAGKGQHVFATIEKRGISTYAAARQIAQALHVSPKEVGTAGLKDAHAITRQVLSINLTTPEAVLALELPHIKILAAERHHNKLKTGHLAGNRFVIRVRNIEPSALPLAEKIVARLAEAGVPNFFGEQRFGNRGNTDLLGEALVRNDPARFVAEFLGQPHPKEPRHAQHARQLVDEGRWDEALAQWPHDLVDERRAVAAVVQSGGKLDAAMRSVNVKLKSLFVSAFQAKLFNMLLVERLDRLGTLVDGDVAYIHGKGASFLVEDAAAEQPRADSFEISPSGPLYGPKALLAEHDPGCRERELLAAHNLTVDSFKVAGLKIRGARRPYRFELKQPNIWWDDGLMVSFELPPGAYATTVLAEIMKN
ncbi:MAG: tRNA pseudouridine synthase D [Anaerolineae bacterium]|nr:tRNA pseudouridine synthase D [Anaerolineae bacterium]